MSINERYGLQAEYGFKIASGSEQAMDRVIGKLTGIESSIKSLQNTLGKGFGAQGLKGLDSLENSAKKATKGLDGMGKSVKNETDHLKGLRQEFSALKAESRLIEMGTLEDANAFDKAAGKVGEYTKALKVLESQITGTSRAERKLSAELKRQVQISDRKVAIARDQRKATTASERQRKALGLSVAGTAIAAPLLGLGVNAVSEYAGFKDSIAELQAISRADDAGTARMEALARELGATTRFKASEVAGAETFLAMSGFQEKQIAASVGATLNLASVGKFDDIASAADVATNTLSAFQLNAEDTARVVDVMALAASTSNTSIQQLGEAFAYGATDAKDFGLSIEEAATLLGMGGNIGIQGSSGGTALRSGLVNLSNAAKQAKLKEIFGVEVVDPLTHANRNIIDIIGDLKSSMDTDFRDPQFAKDLEKVQADVAAGVIGAEEQVDILKGKYPQYSSALDGLAQVFGKTAVSFWSGQISQYDTLKHDSLEKIGAVVDEKVLAQSLLTDRNIALGEGEDIFAAVLRTTGDYQTAVNIIQNATDQLVASGKGGLGFGARAAQQMEDNIAGSFRSLGSAIESLKFAFIEPLAPIIRDIADSLVLLTRTVVGLPGPVKEAIAFAGAAMVGIGLLIAAVGAAGVALFGIQAAMATTSSAMTAMQAGSVPLTGFFGTTLRSSVLSGVGSLGMFDAAAATTTASSAAMATGTAGVAAGMEGVTVASGTAWSAMLGPIIPILGGLALVVGGTYLLYKAFKSNFMGIATITKAVATNIWAFFSQLGTEIIAAIAPVASALSSSWGMITTALTSAFSPIGALINSIAPGLKTITTQGAMARHIATAIVTPLKVIGFTLAGIIRASGMVTAGLIGVGGIIIKALVLPFQLAVNTIHGVISTVGFVARGIVGALVWATTPIRMAWTGFVSGFMSLIHPIVTVARRVAGWLIDALNHNPTVKIPIAWSHAASDVIGTVTGMVGHVFDLIGGILPSIEGAIAGVGKRLLGIPRAMAQALGVPAIQPTLDVFHSMLTSTGQFIRLIIGGAIDWITGKWQAFTSGFRAILAPVVTPAKDVAQGLINALNHNPTVVIPLAWERATAKIHELLGGLPEIGQQVGDTLNKTMGVPELAIATPSLSLTPDAVTIPEVAIASPALAFTPDTSSQKPLQIASEFIPSSTSFDAVKDSIADLKSAALKAYGQMGIGAIAFGTVSTLSFAPIPIAIAAIVLGTTALATNVLGLRTIVKGIGTVALGVYEITGGIFTGVHRMVGATGHVIHALFAAIRGDFSRLGPAWDSVQDAVRLGLNGVIGGFNTMGRGVLQLFRGIGEGVGQIFSPFRPLFMSVQEAVNVGLNGIIVGVNTMGQHILQTLSSVGQGVSHVFNPLREWFSTLGNIATSAADKVYLAWERVGQIVSGMGDKINKASQKVQGVLGRIGLGKGKKQEPYSPSPEAVPISQPIAVEPSPVLASIEPTAIKPMAQPKVQPLVQPVMPEAISIAQPNAQTIGSTIPTAIAPVPLISSQPIPPQSVQLDSVEIQSAKLTAIQSIEPSITPKLQPVGPGGAYPTPDPFKAGGTGDLHGKLDALGQGKASVNQLAGALSTLSPALAGPIMMVGALTEGFTALQTITKSETLSAIKGVAVKRLQQLQSIGAQIAQRKLTLEMVRSRAASVGKLAVDKALMVVQMGRTALIQRLATVQSFLTSQELRSHISQKAGIALDFIAQKGLQLRGFLTARAAIARSSLTAAMTRANIQSKAAIAWQWLQSKSQTAVTWATGRAAVAQNALSLGMVRAKVVSMATAASNYVTALSFEGLAVAAGTAWTAITGPLLPIIGAIVGVVGAVVLVRKAFQANFLGIASLVHWVQGGIAQFGSLMKSGVGESIGLVATAFGDAWNDIQTALGDVFTPLMNVIRSLNPHLQGINDHGLILKGTVFALLLPVRLVADSLVGMIRTIGLITAGVIRLASYIPVLPFKMMGGIVTTIGKLIFSSITLSLRGVWSLVERVGTGLSLIPQSISLIGSVIGFTLSMPFRLIHGWVRGIGIVLSGWNAVIQAIGSVIQTAIITPFEQASNLIGKVTQFIPGFSGGTKQDAAPPTFSASAPSPIGAGAEDATAKWSAFAGGFSSLLAPAVASSKTVGQQMINALNHNPTVKIPIAWDGATARIQGSISELPVVGERAGGQLTDTLANIPPVEVRVSDKPVGQISHLTNAIQQPFVTAMAQTEAVLGHTQSAIAGVREGVKTSYRSMTSSALTFGAISTLSMGPLVFTIGAIGLGVLAVSVNLLGLRKMVLGLGQVVGGVAQIAIGLISGVIGTLKGAATLVSGIGAALRGDFSVMAGAWDQIKSSWMNALTQIRGGFGTIFGGIRSIVYGVLDGIQQTAHFILGMVGLDLEQVGAIARSLTQPFTILRDVIHKAASIPLAAWEKVHGIISKVSNRVGGLIGKAKQAVGLKAKTAAVATQEAIQEPGNFSQAVGSRTAGKSPTINAGMDMARFDEKLSPEIKQQGLFARFQRGRKGLDIEEAQAPQKGGLFSRFQKNTEPKAQEPTSSKSKADKDLKALNKGKDAIGDLSMSLASLSPALAGPMLMLTSLSDTMAALRVLTDLETLSALRNAASKSLQSVQTAGLSAWNWLLAASQEGVTITGIKAAIANSAFVTSLKSSAIWGGISSAWNWFLAASQEGVTITGIKAAIANSAFVMSLKSSAIWGGIVTASNAIMAGGFTGLAASASVAWAAISGPLLPIVAAIGVLIGAVALVYGAFKTKFFGIGKLIAPIGRWFGAFGALLKGEFLGSVSDVTQTVWDQVGRVQGALSDAIAPVLAIGKAFSHGLAIAVKFGARVVKALAVGVVGTALATILLPIKAIAFVLKGVIVTVGTILTGIVKVGGFILNRALTPLRMVFGLVRLMAEFLTGYFAGAFTIIGGVIDEIRSQFGMVFNAIGEAIAPVRKLWSELVALFTPVNAGVEGFGLMKAAIFVALIPLRIMAEAVKLVIRLVGGVLVGAIKVVGVAIQLVAIPLRLIIGTLSIAKKLIFSALAIPFKIVGGIVSGIGFVIGKIVGAIGFVGQAVKTSLLMPFQLVWRAIQFIGNYASGLLAKIPLIGRFFNNGGQTNNAQKVIEPQRFATGGLVRGPGTGTSDSIPALLSNREFVVNAAGTAPNLGILQAMNQGFDLTSALNILTGFPGAIANLTVSQPTLPLPPLPSPETVAEVQAASSPKTISIDAPIHISFGDIKVSGDRAGEDVKREIAAAMSDPRFQIFIKDLLADTLEKTR